MADTIGPLAPWPFRSRPAALTASAVRLGDRDSEYTKRVGMAWQGRALATIDLVPELNFASRFYARMLKQVRLYPALLGDDGKQTPIEDGDPVDALNRIQDPGGGRSQILGAYGRLIFTTGEGSLFGRDLETENERWSFVWNDEIKVETEGATGAIRKIIHKPAGEQSKKEYGPDEAVVYRMWTPHPRSSGEADSPMRSVLDIAEELIVLTQAVRSTAVTRLTNGILFMPQEVAPPPAESGADEDPRSDPFVINVMDHMEAQVENYGSAEARVPIVSWIAGDWIEKIKHLQLHDPQTDYLERELRKEAVERLSLGLDMPPEALKGLGSSNHWAALQILGDMWKSHGFPVAQQFASDLAQVYLRPTLKDMDYGEWHRVVVGIDASQVVVKPDRSDDADKAIDRMAIGHKGYRRLKNIDESDAPSPEELGLLMEMKSRRGPEEPSQNGNRPAEDGPAGPGPEGDSGRRTRVVAAARELGAVEMALNHCRELAGVRLRQKRTWDALAKICLDCTENAINRPHTFVASVIGSDVLQQLHIEPVALVKGGGDSLKLLLVSWGYSEVQAASLAEMVEMYAARTLFDEDVSALPSAFSAQIERMKELASAV